MITLIQLELKKILCRSNLLICAACLLIGFLLFASPLHNYVTRDTTGTQITGSAAIATEQEQDHASTGPMTDVAVSQYILRYQELLANPKNTFIGSDGVASLNDEAAYSYVQPYIKIYRWIAATYDDPSQYTGLRELPYLDSEAASSFYDRRTEKIELILNGTSPQYSPQEKSYWHNLASKVTVPFNYGYSGGWRQILNTEQLLIFMILAIGLCLSSVFSVDRATRAEAFVLTSQYGRTKDVTAKIVSGWIFLTGFFLVFTALYVTVPLLLFSTEGGNLPLQIINAIIPYPYSFVQGIALIIVIAYLITFAFGTFVILLSLVFKTVWPPIMFTIGITFLPIFIPSGTNPIVKKLLSLLPTNFFLLDFSEYISFQIAGITLDIYTAEILLCIFMIIIDILLCKCIATKQTIGN